MESKKIILCDTNIIIEYLKGNSSIIEKLELIGKDSIYISSITAGELYFGAINKLELNSIQKKLNSIIHIPITEPISNLFEDLMIKYSLSHKLSIPNAILATTAIYYEIELFTLNIKDFKFIKGINLYK